MRRWTLFLGVWFFAACAGSSTEGGTVIAEEADVSGPGADADRLTFVDVQGPGDDPEPEPEPEPDPECSPEDEDVACDDASPCTKDTCESGFCVNMPFEGICDDGDACTENDLCAAGVCAGVSVGESHCDDGNDCTADSCDAKAGCRNWLMDTHACRPDIQVDYPPRAAGLV
ncbi:MAG: hypothetical protein VX938_11555, partial [Myxococcota bacterium]|nr:hypothetical protein [Myxococcota bacterium]